MKTPAIFLVLLLPAVLAFSGCAGTALDRDFRAKVRAVDVDPTASYDPASGVFTGGAHTHFELRDPSKD